MAGKSGRGCRCGRVGSVCVRGAFANHSLFLPTTQRRDSLRVHAGVTPAFSGVGAGSRGARSELRPAARAKGGGGGSVGKPHSLRVRFGLSSSPDAASRGRLWGAPRLRSGPDGLVRARRCSTVIGVAKYDVMMKLHDSQRRGRPLRVQQRASKWLDLFRLSPLTRITPVIAHQKAAGRPRVRRRRPHAAAWAEYRPMRRICEGAGLRRELHDELLRGVPRQDLSDDGQGVWLSVKPVG